VIKPKKIWTPLVADNNVTKQELLEALIALLSEAESLRRELNNYFEEQGAYIADEDASIKNARALIKSVKKFTNEVV
jgi:hypothetical protein